MPDRTGWCVAPKGYSTCGVPALPDLPVKLCPAHAREVHDVVQRVDATAGRRQRRERRLKDPGVIYYLRVGALVKVGFTTDMKQRMTSYPPDAVLLATEPGSLAKETRLHREFRPYRAQAREWYHPDPVLLAHIDTLRQDAA